MKQLLFANIWWKLLSLVLALLLWMAIVGDPEVTTSVWATVQYKNIPRHLEISSEVVDRVHLEVHGPAGQLTGPKLAEVTVVLDLGRVDRPGERTFGMQSWSPQLPPGVKIERAVPAQVQVRFERRLRREAPVEVRLAGPPPDGYRIVSQETEPATLAIEGPESRVTQVEAVYTEPIDLSHSSGMTRFEVHGSVNDGQVRLVESRTIIVRIKLEQMPASK